MKIISIPFGGGGLGKGNGARKAPEKIIEQLKEQYANEEGKETKHEFETIKVEENNVEESHKIITRRIKENNEKAIIIGGDHSITQPIIKGLKQRVEEDIMLIVFDAHPDLMHYFTPPTQEDYLRVLIEEKTIKPENIIIIGIRNWDKEEIKYLKEKKIKYYGMKEIYEKGIKETIKEITTRMREERKKTYLSIDIDVVDPVEAIGTGYQEHGGLSSRELIHCIQEIKKTGLIIMADIVEVNPEKDIQDMTSKLAAKIITELGEF